MVRPIRWSYGVTTVPSRKETLLPKTLASLTAAGFDRPHLFVDGTSDGYEALGLELTYRNPKIRPYGNWVLGLAELYIRNPACHFYAMFQDDILVSKNLRDYLEGCKYPDKGYWNLITYPKNQALAPAADGWFLSNQRGLGAQGLVFNREAVQVLLCHQNMVERPTDAKRGWKNIDGAIIGAFRKIGTWKEYVHSPSLIYHTGSVSSFGNCAQPEAVSFKGEGFDIARPSR